MRSNFFGEVLNKVQSMLADVLVAIGGNFV